MKTIKYLFAVLALAMTLSLANTATTQAAPASTFQRIIVRTGPGYHRGWHRPYYRRPYYRRGFYHRGWHRPYRRF